MNSVPVPRRQSALAAVLLLAAVAAVYGILIHPAVKARRANAERLADIQFQYAKLSRAASELERQSAALERLRAAPIDETDFLTGNTVPIAAAELQRQVKLFVEDLGGSLLSTRVMPGSDKLPFPAVTVAAQMRLDVESLQQLLARAASGSPVLIIDALTVQTRGVSGTRRRAAEGRALDVQLEITGFVNRRGGASG